MIKSNSLHLLGALFLALTIGLAATASATTVSFPNSDLILIPEAGKASPYPSSIEVSGIVETVVDVNVTLSGLYHTWADDLYFVLKGATGESVVLWNDAGGGTSLFNDSVVFDDEAAGAIPNSGPVGSGSYQVSQYGSIPGAADTAPAPDPGFGGSLALFDGLDPNGDWELYAYDDANGDEGFLSNGWSLTFETQPIPEPTAAVLFAVGTFVVGGTLRRRRA
jgi:hypothetical protein